jgi:DNA-binding CsgD family transcriptional regulator
MVAQGYRQAKIALAMGYSIAWVQWRLKTIYTQMGVKNRAQLAALVGEERQRRSR